MTRAQLLARVDREWQGFVQAYQGLAEKYLLEPGVVGQWSVKDLMGHIATWEEETLAALTLIMQGKRPLRYARYGGIDAFNDRKWQEFRNLPFERVQSWSRETHAQLVAFLVAVPEDRFATETRFRHRLRLDTYGHYPEHRLHILEWRQSRDL